MDYNITYREKDKGIQVIVSYKNQYGKWKQKSKQGFKKKSDAKKYADKIIEELKKTVAINLNSEYEGITLKKYLEVFMKDKELIVEQNTINTYKNTLKWFEKIENMSMSDIKHIHIVDCVNDMIKAGLKRNTIRSYLTKINHIFDSAVEPYKIIASNPIGKIRLPEEKENNKIKALNKAELDDLLKRIKPAKDFIITMIAATCGLRIGEILGLTWSDIDFKNNLITVNKQWKKLKNKTYGLGAVKERRSNRTIPMPISTKKALEQYKANNPTDLQNRVILDYNTDTTSSRLYLKYRRLGYEISVHDLRHTYATMLLADGLDYKTVANLMGDTVQIVMKNYSHVNNDMIKIATDKINSLF